MLLPRRNRTLRADRLRLIRLTQHSLLHLRILVLDHQYLSLLMDLRMASIMDLHLDLRASSCNPRRNRLPFRDPLILLLTTLISTIWMRLWNRSMQVRIAILDDLFKRLPLIRPRRTPPFNLHPRPSRLHLAYILPPHHLIIRRHHRNRNLDPIPFNLDPSPRLPRPRRATISTVCSRISRRK